MSSRLPLSTLLSQVLVAYTIELDNEFERRFAETGESARVVSLVMWSNFLRFVGAGITVGELSATAGLPKARTMSTLGGMERWRYVFVGPASIDRPPNAKRDGWGSARGLRGDWLVRPTPAGRKAQEIWPSLFNEIEGRWEERFGRAATDALRGSLAGIGDRIDLELPEYLPIVGSSDGMTAGPSALERRSTSPDKGNLAALLSQVLLAYTIDFERESELSLPLSANFVRVLDRAGVSVRDLPRAAGVSKEATSMALGFLEKTGYVVVEGASAASKVAGLTPKGWKVQRTLPRLQVEIEDAWATRFDSKSVRKLRASLEDVLGQRDGETVRLSRGLHPHPAGWRASKPYLDHTQAMIDDPGVGLPHYPMVLHRGGWPDGS